MGRDESSVKMKSFVEQSPSQFHGIAMWNNSGAVCDQIQEKLIFSGWWLCCAFLQRSVVTC